MSTDHGNESETRSAKNKNNSIKSQISSKTIIMNNHAYKILSFFRERPSTKPNIRTIKRGQPRNFEFNFNFKLYQFYSFIFHSFLLKTNNNSNGENS